MRFRAGEINDRRRQAVTAVAFDEQIDLSFDPLCNCVHIRERGFSDIIHTCLDYRLSQHGNEITDYLNVRDADSNTLFAPIR